MADCASATAWGRVRVGCALLAWVDGLERVSSRFWLCGGGVAAGRWCGKSGAVVTSAPLSWAPFRSSLCLPKTPCPGVPASGCFVALSLGGVLSAPGKWPSSPLLSLSSCRPPLGPVAAFPPVPALVGTLVSSPHVASLVVIMLGALRLGFSGVLPLLLCALMWSVSTPASGISSSLCDGGGGG